MLQCNVPWSRGTIWRSRVPDWRHIQQTRAFTSQFCHSCPFQVVQHKHCSIVRSQVSEPKGDVHSEVSITSKMPQISGRKRCLTDLEGYLKLDMLFEPVRQLDEDDELDPPYGPDIGGGQALVDPTGNLLPKQFPPLPFDSDSESEDEAEMMTSSIACLYFTVSSFRYMAPRFKQPRSVDYIYEYFRCQSDNDFRAITRVTKEVFKCIVDLLSPDPIFYTKAKHKQAPVHWQVACALDKLGNDGQGVSAARSKLIWGLGHGTVFLYYKRVVHALCKLRGDYIQWPDMIQRLQISTRLEQKGFKDAVAFVDGACFPLHHKPSFHGNDYLDRKKNYSINAQVVCDDRHRILHFSTGMPGSVHDSRMFYLSPLMRHPERYFSPGQYLLGDSGYATSLYLVAAYKENQRDDPNDLNECFDIERFMYELARTRVINEHTIGILKSRWSSLRGLRMNLRTNTDVFKVMHHTIACVVLHNLLLEMDPWDDESAMNEVERDGPTQDCSEDLSGPQRRAGKQKRYEVRKACLAFLDSIGETFEPQI